MCIRDRVMAEDFYEQPPSQLYSGQNTVKYPFRPDPLMALRDSYNSSLSCLLSLELIPSQDPSLKSCMLNSWTIILPRDRWCPLLTQLSPSDLLPTTEFSKMKVIQKIQVVFDASAPTATGMSLNDLNFKLWSPMS